MTEIEDRYVNRAKKLVLEKFPEMAGAEPSVSTKRSQGKGLGHRSGQAASPTCCGQYVLTFERDVALPGGHNLKRLVRVTMDESGEVVKVISSK